MTREKSFSLSLRQIFAKVQENQTLKYTVRILSDVSHAKNIHNGLFLQRTILARSWAHGQQIYKKSSH